MPPPPRNEVWVIVISHHDPSKRPLTRPCFLDGGGGIAGYHQIPKYEKKSFNQPTKMRPSWKVSPPNTNLHFHVRLSCFIRIDPYCILPDDNPYKTAWVGFHPTNRVEMDHCSNVVFLPKFWWTGDLPDHDAHGGSELGQSTLLLRRSVDASFPPREC